MALSRGVNVAVTGAGSADTGLKVITAVNVAVSAAATVNLRMTSAAGTIVAQQVLGAAGQFTPAIPAGGLRCNSGNWFIENSAGNLTGGVAGY